MLLLLQRTCNFFFFCCCCRWFVYRFVGFIRFGGALFLTRNRINRRLGCVCARSRSQAMLDAFAPTAAASSSSSSSPFLGYWIHLCKTNNSFSRALMSPLELGYVLEINHNSPIWLRSPCSDDTSRKFRMHHSFSGRSLTLRRPAPFFFSSSFRLLFFPLLSVSKQSANVERSFIYVQKYFVCERAHTVLMCVVHRSVVHSIRLIVDEMAEMAYVSTCDCTGE